MVSFRTVRGSTETRVSALRYTVILTLVTGLIGLMFFLVPRTYTLFDIYARGPGPFVMRTLFLALAIYCLWHTASGLFYLAQLRGRLPVLIARRGSGGLKVGSFLAMTFGRGRLIGSQTELRLDVTGSGREWVLWGHRETALWRIRTGGLEARIRTAVEMNAEVEHELREFLEGLRQPKEPGADSPPTIPPRAP
ncbi:MAG: hypothetical protein CVT64_06975 [Actinobacteria bacterium HGW-Actinobacteria-4]|nr:MAG: hypothetical protein CVT64_06975 [Actinobacteria bacterium HGW-Actinobacteria-4]